MNMGLNTDHGPRDRDATRGKSMTQDEHHKEHIEQIKTAMRRRQQERDQLEQLLESFTKRLYAGFQQAVTTLRQQGVEGIGDPRVLKHPGGGWRRVMQLLIEDWSIFIVPMVGVAWPNVRDEAMIHASAFKEVCARVGFFLSKSVEPDPVATAFYDIIVLADSSWFAWGYGWPKQQATADATNFANLAMEMLASFTKDVHLTWAVRDETCFADVMDPKRRAYNFGLPGQE